MPIAASRGSVAIRQVHIPSRHEYIVALPGNMAASETDITIHCVTVAMWQRSTA
ncbi:hypothetical protein FLA_4145 [Filimonas lacunae]|nr:hypothetical protein FLA_4145 [Filimonas lacunae]